MISTYEFNLKERAKMKIIFFEGLKVEGKF